MNPLANFGGIRAYFSPCGIGYGHIARCHPIADELMKKGAEVLFSTYLEGVNYAEKFQLPVVQSPALSVNIDETGQINIKMTSTQAFEVIPQFIRQVNAEIENMRAFKPDIVISDSRISSLVAAKLLGVPSLVILNQFLPIMPRRKRFFNLSRIADGTVLTLLSQGWSLSESILIPDFSAPYTISLGNLRIPERVMPRVRYIGTILNGQPRLDQDAAAMKSKLGIEQGRALIFCPISGPKEERQPLIEKLVEIFQGFPSEYEIVLSLGDVSAISEPIRKENFTVASWIDNRFEYLQGCDIVVSRAGHSTIMQSIFFSKPQIIIPTPGHTEQYGNARRAQELGLAKVIDQQDITRARILSEIEEILGEPESYLANVKKIREQQSFEGVTNTLSEISRILRRG